MSKPSYSSVFSLCPEHGFARVPFDHTTFQTILPSSCSQCPEHGCQGCLRSHHMSKPSYLPRWSFPYALNMAFARVPFAHTTCPNHLTFLLIFSQCPEHDVCQGSLRSHHMSKPSYLPLDLFPMPWTWRLPGFPSLAPHVQTILPSSWSFPYALNMAFARVPFAHTTCPNHLTFLLIFSQCPEHGVCQGCLRSHHMSKPSYLPRDLFPMPWTWRLPGFPSLAPHVQTILPSSWSFPYALNMAFARVPFARTTRPNHLTFLVISSLCPEHGVCQGSLRSHHMSKPSYLPLDLFPMPWTWRLSGFPSLAPHVQTILPSSWSFPYALNMAFARVPFARTTRPNHLTFLFLYLAALRCTNWGVLL